MNKLGYALSQLKVTFAFPQKLKHNFHELTLLEKLIYVVFIRPFWTSGERFFFEGHWGLRGQMYKAERRALYETIVKFQPRFCLEIGTYTGGGSTFFLSRAFKSLGQGKLFTLEADQYYYDKARQYYTRRLLPLAQFIEFQKGNTIDQFGPVLKKYGGVDCVLLDGAENGQATLDQYNFIKPYFKSGSILMMHDWNTDKTKLIKPVISNDSNWNLVAELEPPHSVGLAIFRHK